MHPLSLSEKQHIIVSGQDRKQHILITGLPHTGVATFLTDLILSDNRNAQPAIILDMYGDVTKKIEKNAAKNIQIISVGVGEKNQLNLNLFSDTTTAEVTEGLLKLLYGLYDPNHQGIIGPRFEHSVRNAIATIMYTDNPSFVNLIRVFTDPTYITELLPRITDSVVKNYWSQQIAQTSDFHKSETLDYIVSKLSPFVINTRLRSIMGATDDTYSMHDLLQQKKIIVCDFSLFLEEENEKRIITAVFMQKLLQTMKKHQDPLAIYIDELTFWPESALSELLMYDNRHTISLISYTSFLLNMSEQIQRQLLRAGTLVSFRQSYDEAKLLAPYFLSNVTVHDLCLLKKYHTYMKTLIDGNVSSAKLVNLEK